MLFKHCSLSSYFVFIIRVRMPAACLLPPLPCSPFQHIHHPPTSLVYYFATFPAVASSLPMPIFSPTINSGRPFYPLLFHRQNKQTKLNTKTRQLKMSMSLWDPFNTSRRVVAPWRRGFYNDPFDTMERSLNMLDRFFDDSLNVQLRDHAAQLQISEQGDLNYKVDVSGFRPEELDVQAQGNEIVIRGEHREQNQSESVHRQFVRRVIIPEGIQRETIKCDLDNSGRLCICAKRNPAETRSIPIDLKQSQAQVTGGGQQQIKQ